MDRNLPSALFLARQADIPEAGGYRVQLPNGLDIALFRTSAGIRAVENRCPHAGGRLDDGLVRGNELMCIWHGWRFDLRSGDCRNHDGNGLRFLDIFIEAGGIYLPADSSRPFSQHPKEEFP